MCLSPFSKSSCDTVSAFTLSMSTTATLAPASPRAWANARPMPCPAPVTYATFPSRRMRSRMGRPLTPRKTSSLAIWIWWQDNYAWLITDVVVRTAVMEEYAPSPGIYGQTSVLVHWGTKATRRIMLMPSLRGTMVWKTARTLSADTRLSDECRRRKGFETYLLHTWIIRHKLVELSKSQTIRICCAFKINFGFEEGVVNTYDTPQSHQIVVEDEVVVIDVIILISINENHVKLFSCGSQFLERITDDITFW